MIPFASLLLEEPVQGDGGFVIITTEALLHDVTELVWTAMDDEETIRQKKIKRGRNY
jgi:hypothetical protein